MPELDGIALLSRLAHVLSAVVLGGGLIYLRMMIVPRQLAAADAADSAAQFFLGLRSRWAICVMICAALLIASGLYNYITKVRVEKYPMPYHALFGVKFLLGLLVIFAASIVAGRTEAAERARARVRLWLNLAIAGVVVVIAIGSTMRTFHGEPKTVEPAATARASLANFAEPANRDTAGHGQKS